MSGHRDRHDVAGGRRAPGDRRAPQPVQRAARELLGGDRPLVAAAVAAVVLATVVVSGPLRTWMEQREQVEELEAALSTLEDDNAELSERVEELNDPEQLEQLAREEQGMVRPGEVPYVIVPPEVDEPVVGRDLDVEPARDERSWLRRAWDALAGAFAE